MRDDPNRWNLVLACMATLLLGSTGCNEQPPYGDDDDGAVSAVDVVWIVDSSNSMHGKQQALKAAFSAMLDALDASGVDVDYQMGVTTTQSRPCQFDPTAFADCQDSHGTAGRLRGLDNAGGDTSHPPTCLRPGDPGLDTDFQTLVDVGIYGATEEYGLWVMAEAICASLELPHDSDFADWGQDTAYECDGSEWDPSHEWAEFCRCQPGEHHDYNVDDTGTRFLRDDAALMVVIVSDEGDFTPLMGATEWPWDVSDCAIGEPWPQGIQQQCAGNPEALCLNYCKLDRFLRFFGTLDRPVVISVIGPGAQLVSDGDTYWTEVDCNDQNSSLAMIEFYLWAAELTGGVYAKIVEWDGECSEDPDFGPVMADIAQLMVDLVGG